MHTLYHDTMYTDDARRRLLYQGELFLYSPRRSTIALCDLARDMLEDAFGPLDPRKAQYSMPVEQFVAICSPLKPRFIHDGRTRMLIRDILEEFRCDLQQTFQDVPRLRMVTSDGYLTAGVGYAHHPHRDTWYSAPMTQINWWLPIYDFATEASLAFHPQYWHTPVMNSSSGFNYYKWNSVGRRQAASQIKTDTREQPKPLEPMQLDPQLRVVCPAGGALLFSAAHMHSTVPNTSGATRFSIDFRTVNLADLQAGLSAPNIDSAPQGTSLRDFVRAADLTSMPADLIARYDNVSDCDGELVFTPDPALTAGRLKD